MTRDKKKKVRTSSLEYYALKYSDKMTENSELRKIDMTEIFYADLKIMLKNMERFNLTILGQTASGKSTVGIALGKWTLETCKQLEVMGKKKQFELKNIMRSQHEFDKYSRDTQAYNDVIVVDEFLSADETGENITVIQAVRTQISDQHAQRNIRTINITPTVVMDKNSKIVLQVIPQDKKVEMTRCWLMYKLQSGEMEYWQLLGFVDVKLGDLLENWVGKGLKDKYFNPEKTKEDTEFIKKYQKQDVYVNYMIKKFEKMNLLTEEKIYRERELDYAEVIIKVVDELLPLTKLNFITRDIVESYCKMYARRYDVPQSIVGARLMSEKVYSILKYWETYWKLNKKLAGLDKKRAKGQVSDEVYKLKSEEIMEMRDTLVRSVTQLREEYEHMLEVKKKYEKIENE